MGSSSNQQQASNSYILGLWGADGYHRTSSIGLTSIYPELIKRFHLFLNNKFPLERIRLRVYSNNKQHKLSKTMSWFKGKLHFSKGTKLRHFAYQVYVNSRPLLRKFRQAVDNRLILPPDDLAAYFAGRFDGDGSVAKDLRTDFRIVYTNFAEANTDKQLLEKLGFDSRIYRYKKAGTHVIYVSRFESLRLCKALQPYSAKLKRLLVTP